MGPLASRIAARWVLGLASGEEVARAATDALVAGHDGDALRRLAAETDPLLADISDLVPQALAEWHVEMPSPRDAALFLAREYAEAIVAGSLAPFEGARLICRQLASHVGDGSLDGFVYWEDEYEDATDTERVAYCSEALVQVARAVLRAA